jgi:ABC-type multidrug transport system ATPase subunit
VTSKSTAIELVGVQKWYATTCAFRTDEFRVNCGERLLVSGDNASGKSTFLRICARVSKPSIGTVKWATELKTASVGFVPQHGGFYPELSLQQNLTLWRRLFSSTDTEACRKLLETFGLQRFEESPISRLSGGYQRLAAITLALAVKPRVLFLDEPFAGLDQSKQEAVTRVLTELTAFLDVLMITSPQRECPLHDMRIVTLREANIV